MLTLQEQVVQKINGLSEDNLQFLLEMIERFMQPAVTENGITVSKRIGIAKGQKLYDDDYDFNEMNPEIEKMFKFCGHVLSGVGQTGEIFQGDGRRSGDYVSGI